jgi:hypothetical protein
VYSAPAARHPAGIGRRRWILLDRETVNFRPSAKRPRGKPIPPDRGFRWP